MTHIRTAVFPIAGISTPFVGAAQSIPYALRPLLDRPLIQYAIDEAKQAGIENFIFVSSTSGGALKDYVETTPEWEQTVWARGDRAGVRALQHKRSILCQAQPLGLGHAVRQAKPLIGDMPFAVLLPDDVIKCEKGVLAQMMHAHRYAGGHMVATMDVPRRVTHKYGILDITKQRGRMSYVCGMVEKPCADIAPSTAAVIGRYILNPSIFDRLDTLKPGADGLLQLTDAIHADIGSVPVTGYSFDGDRFDCSTARGYAQAANAFAMDPTGTGDCASRFAAERNAQLRLVS